MNLLRRFWNDEGGQDLIEYTLLMAFVALAAAGLFLATGNTIIGVWNGAGQQLNAANAAIPKP